MPMATRYISSLYWALAAMSTVGLYRALSSPPWSLWVILPLLPGAHPPTHDMSQVGYCDLKPRNDAETGTGFAIELLGVACSGYVVGTVSLLTSKSAKREVHRVVRELRER